MIQLPCGGSFARTLCLGLFGLAIFASGTAHAQTSPARPNLTKVIGSPLVGGMADDVEARCDFNADGINDILTSDRTNEAQGLRIRLGNGDGKFGIGTIDFAFSPDGPTSIAVGALTGNDSRPDIAAAVSGTIRVIANAAGAGGAPVLSQAANLSVSGTTLKEVEVADLNNDGLSDIVATGEGLSSLGMIEGKVVVFLNSANGFGTGQTLQSPGTSATRLALGDIDANGFADIAVVNAMEGSIALYMAAAGGGFTSTPVKRQLFPNDRPGGIALGQISGDAQLEVAVWRESPLNDGSGQYILGYSLFRHTGSGNLAFMTGVAYDGHPDGAYQGDIAIADLNFDGVADIVFTNPFSKYVVVNAVVLDANGNVNPSASPFYEYSTSNAPKRISISNLNKDTTTVGSTTYQKLDVVAIVQPVTGDKCVDVFLNGVSGGGGGGANQVPEGKLNAVATEGGWSFTATFPSTPSFPNGVPNGVFVKVQYSATPDNPSSWQDVPNGYMTPINGRKIWSLKTSSVPMGNFAFRVVTEPSIGSTYTGSASVPTKTYTSKLDISIADMTKTTGIHLDLKKARIGKFKGVNPANGAALTLEQITKRVDGDHGEFVWYALRVVNTGDSYDRFTLTGPANGDQFLFSYLRPDPENLKTLEEISPEIKNGSFEALLAPREVATFYVSIRVSAKLAVDSVHPFDFIARSKITPSIADTARAEIEVVKPRNVFYVTTTDDNGNDNSPTPGSLREAIIKAQLNFRNDSRIAFELDILPGAFTRIDVPKQFLPILVKNIVFDGQSQADFQAAKINNFGVAPVELRGPGTGIGLNIQTSGCTVVGMAFTNFTVGVQITGTVEGGGRVKAEKNKVYSCRFEGNSEAGVLITGGADDNTIGSSTQGNGFYSTFSPGAVRGNYGVSITGQGTILNKVKGNVIGSVGTEPSRTGADVSQGFALAGVSVRDGAGGNYIGGRFGKGEGNYIVGNFGGNITANVARGLELLGVGTNANFVQGNTFGSAFGGFLRPNKGDNIVIDLGASDNLIGGVDTWTSEGYNRPEGVGNLIMNSARVGVAIRSTNGSVCERNRIEGNRIGGLNEDEGNFLGGVAIAPAATLNVVGGKAAGTANVIQGNGGGSNEGGGVVLIGCSGNSVQGNYIGIDAQDRVFGNSRGILLFQASRNTIGSNNKLGRNVISGNFGEGILMDGSNVNVVFGNYIGVAKDGVTVKGNAKAGVEIQNGSNDNEIGGTGAGFGNLIRGNGDSGVRVTGASVRNSIRGNNHGPLSEHTYIDLVGGAEDGNGYTTNDQLDSDTGPNDLQNGARITNLEIVGGKTKITGTFNSTPRTDTTISKFAFDVHADGEYVNTVSFQTDREGDPVSVGPGDPNGNGTFIITLPEVLRGKNVSIVVTQFATQGAQTDSRSTSEHSNTGILP